MPVRQLRNASARHFGLAVEGGNFSQVDEVRRRLDVALRIPLLDQRLDLAQGRSVFRTPSSRLPSCRSSTLAERRPTVPTAGCDASRRICCEGPARRSGGDTALSADALRTRPAYQGSAASPRYAPTQWAHVSRARPEGSGTSPVLRQWRSRGGLHPRCRQSVREQTPQTAPALRSFWRRAKRPPRAMAVGWPAVDAPGGVNRAVSAAGERWRRTATGAIPPETVATRCRWRQFRRRSPNRAAGRPGDTV